jgi:hypothetical protein
VRVCVCASASHSSLLTFCSHYSSPQDQDCSVSSFECLNSCRCSATCGGGLITYRRRVLAAPTGNGRRCPQLYVDEPCNPQACPSNTSTTPASVTNRPTTSTGTTRRITSTTHRPSTTTATTTTTTTTVTTAPVIVVAGSRSFANSKDSSYVWLFRTVIACLQFCSADTPLCSTAACALGTRSPLVVLQSSRLFWDGGTCSRSVMLTIYVVMAHHLCVDR